MIKAEQDEIRDLVSRGKFKAVIRTELPDSANMITARYVMATKSKEDKVDR